jgi:hypothetical protein
MARDDAGLPQCFGDGMNSVALGEERVGRGCLEPTGGDQRVAGDIVWGRDGEAADQLSELGEEAARIGPGPLIPIHNHALHRQRTRRPVAARNSGVKS